MDDTSGSTRCSRCGTEYSGQSSPLGLCPSCLMALGMSGQIEESGIRNQESAGVGPEESASVTQQESTRALQQTRAKRHRWLVMAGVALLLALVVLSGFMLRRIQDAAAPAPPLTSSTVRFTLPYPDGTEAIDGAQFAVSPDGKNVVVAARAADGSSRLWLRRLQALDWQELSGTVGAVYPFWSPDSRHVGFFADRRLKRIDLGNALTQVVCEAPDGHGGAWGAHNEIVFAPGGAGPLFRVAASGGAPEQITKLEAGQMETAHLWPHFIGDDHHLVFFANAADPRGKGNLLLDLERGIRAIVAQHDVAVVPAGGTLLFAHTGTLAVQRLDLARPAPELDLRMIAGADSIGGPMSVGPNYAATSTVLVYRQVQPRLSELVWFDRSGRAIGNEGEPADYRGIAISPDGRAIVAGRLDERKNVSNLWRIDVARSTTSRLTFGTDRDIDPVWSPDGRRVAFASRREGQPNLALTAMSVAGDGKKDQLVEGPLDMHPTDWSRDSSLLIYTSNDPRTHLDVWAVPLAGERRPSPIAQTPFNESDAHLSPDGRSIAYVSDETGRDEVFVRSFPSPEGKWLISSNGGRRPRWRADGREVFFTSPDGMLMAASVQARPLFEAGPPQPLFEIRHASDYAVAPDGRFLVQLPRETPGGNQLHVVLNWMTEVNR
jgi:Tol biopolymer transport system component